MNAENMGVMKRILVEERVDAFLEELADKGSCVRKNFTRKQMDEKFIDVDIAREIFQTHGFFTKTTGEHSIRFLWWIKHYPETWEIITPTEYDELDF